MCTRAASCWHPLSEPLQTLTLLWSPVLTQTQLGVDLPVGHTHEASGMVAQGWGEVLAACGRPASPAGPPAHAAPATGGPSLL